MNANTNLACFGRAKLCTKLTMLSLRIIILLPQQSPKIPGNLLLIFIHLRIRKELKKFATINLIEIF